MFQRIELILTPSIGLDTIVRTILSSRRGSHCSSRDNVGAEGTSCMLGTKKCRNFDYFQRPVTKMPSQGLEISLLFFFPQVPLLKNCCTQVPVTPSPACAENFTNPRNDGLAVECVVCTGVIWKGFLDILWRDNKPGIPNTRGYPGYLLTRDAITRRLRNLAGVQVGPYPPNG